LELEKAKSVAVVDDADQVVAEEPAPAPA